MESLLASVAQYFRIALEVGLCEPEQVRDWAISVIDRMDEPPGEIIEVSWRKPQAQLISDLKDVKGEPETELVCQWLLGRLSRTLAPANDGLALALTQAKLIAYAAGDAGLYDMFNVIEDEFFLAEAETFGTVAECRAEFEKALNEHGMPPFSLYAM